MSRLTSGFGIGGGLAALGGVSYALKRRVFGDDEQ